MCVLHIELNHFKKTNATNSKRKTIQRSKSCAACFQQLDPSKLRTWFDNFLNMPTASKSPSACNMNPTKTQTQTLFAPIRVLNLLPHFDCTGLGSSSHSTKKLSRNIDLCEQQRWHEAMGSENSFEKSTGFVHTCQKECAKKSKATGTNNINT